MTEKAKKLYDFLKKDKEVLEKFCKVNTIQGVLDLAKEYHFDITEEDLGITPEKKEILENKKKMDMKELEKVSGSGDSCRCIICGCGASDEKICSCSLGGSGDDGNDIGNFDCKSEAFGSGEGSGSGFNICIGLGVY